MYKILVFAKPLRINFDNIDEFIRDNNETKYLVLFGLENYNAIYGRIRYVIRYLIII